MPFRPVQAKFRGRDDSVGLNTNTFTYAQDAAFSYLVDTPFRIRFLIQETGGSDGAYTWHLRYSKNSGGYSSSTNITNATAQVKIVNSTQFADLDVTSSLLGGSGTWANGTGNDSSENTGTVSLLANGNSEVEFCLQLVSADVVNGDVFEFRLYRGTTAAYSYTTTPAVTAIKNINAAITNEPVKITEVITNEIKLSPSLSESFKASEVLSVEVAAPAIADMTISSEQSAKITEEIGVEVSNQVNLEPSVSESAKVTEAITVESNVIDLSAQASQSFQCIDYISPPLTQAIRVTEQLIVQLDTQPDLLIDKAESLKLTEDVTINCESPVTLAADVTTTVRITEAQSTIVEGLLPDLDAIDSETIHISESLEASVGMQITLSPNISDAAKITEDRTVTISTPIAQDVNISDAVRVTEAIASSIDTPLTLSPSASQSAKVTESLTVEVAAQTDRNIDISDHAKITEDYAAAVLAPDELAPLQIVGPFETVRVTEALTTSILAQLAVELAAIDSVRIIDVSGATKEEADPLISVAFESVSISEETTGSISSPITVELQSIDYFKITERIITLVKSLTSIIEIDVAVKYNRPTILVDAGNPTIPVIVRNPEISSIDGNIGIPVEISGRKKIQIRNNENIAITEMISIEVS